MEQMYDNLQKKAIAKTRYKFRKGYLQVSLREKNEVRQELMQVFGTADKAYFSQLLNKGIVNIRLPHYDLRPPRHHRRMDHRGSIATLTVREGQVAERIAWGASQKEVADDLGISRHTVDNILRKIYQKLHIGKINELSAWWFCTTFGISFDLSPLKRAIGAVCLAGIFIAGEMNHDFQFCRYREGRVRIERIIRLKE